MPLLVLLFLFIVVPLGELYVIIQVGQAIGALNTIGLLLLDSIVGSWLLRTQGRSVWLRFNQALAEGKPPAREVLDGGLVIFGGALLLSPGFITDGFGLILLLPPTRALVRRLLVRGFARRFFVAGPLMGGFGPGRPPGGSPPDDDVVDGHGVDVDQPTLRP
jgi:UPF0716 protein FxsA